MNPNCHEVCPACLPSVRRLGEEKSVGKISGPDTACALCGTLTPYTDLTHIDGDPSVLREAWEKARKASVKVNPELMYALVQTEQAFKWTGKDKGGQWCLYVNVDMGHSAYGHQQALLVGPDCTHKTPPPHLADGHHGPGWRYTFHGWINMTTQEATP